MTGQLALLSAGLTAPAAGWFSSRGGGVSPRPWQGANLAVHTGDDPDRVHANRGMLAHEVGLEAGDLVFAEQVHGAGVALVTAETPRGRGADLPCTDALVTCTAGVALVLLGADCPPVLLADAAAGVVAVAHVGRSGLLAGVLMAALAVMTDCGALPGRVQAVIGPGVCGRCYEVPAALAAQAELLAPGSGGTTRHGTPSVDLAAGIGAQLRRAGLSDITAVGGCTMEDPALFSYRRDGRTGRHGGMALLR